MSIYTTLHITRSRAARLYVEKKLGLDDQMLERFLDEYLESRLFNAIVVNDDEKNQDDVLAWD